MSRSLRKRWTRSRSIGGLGRCSRRLAWIRRMRRRREREKREARRDNRKRLSRKKRLTKDRSSRKQIPKGINNSIQMNNTSKIANNAPNNRPSFNNTYRKCKSSHTHPPTTNPSFYPPPPSNPTFSTFPRCFNSANPNKSVVNS
jgi:hypothetical protein